MIDSGALLRGASAGLAAAALAAACATTPGPSAAPSAAGSSQASLASGPLDSLPACRPAPPASGDEPPDVLVLPEGAVVTEVGHLDPLTTVQGYLPMTPVEALLSFDAVETYTTVQAEDEVIEAEVLISVDGQRIYLKAQAICDRGAIFVAVIAPEEAASAVPTPSGSPRPGAG